HSRVNQKHDIIGFFFVTGPQHNNQILSTDSYRSSFLENLKKSTELKTNLLQELGIIYMDRKYDINKEHDDATNKFIFT
ncbi:3911_t:CDS:1, partial [Cetraspora pellucida]